MVITVPTCLHFYDGTMKGLPSSRISSAVIAVNETRKVETEMKHGPYRKYSLRVQFIPNLLVDVVPTHTEHLLLLDII